MTTHENEEGSAESRVLGPVRCTSLSISQTTSPYQSTSDTTPHLPLRLRPPTCSAFFAHCPYSVRKMRQSLGLRRVELVGLARLQGHLVWTSRRRIGRSVTRVAVAPQVRACPWLEKASGLVKTSTSGKNALGPSSGFSNEIVSLQNDRWH